MPSLLTYLLSGYGPESEMFIDQNVYQFKFLNTTNKESQLINLENFYGFKIEKNVTNKGKYIYDITKNEIINGETFFVKTNNKKIEVIWKFDNYLSEANRGKNVQTIVTTHETEFINVDIMKFIKSSYDESMKDIVNEHLKKQFVKCIYYYIDGVDILETKQSLQLYPHFIYRNTLYF